MWIKVARYHLVRPANYLAVPVIMTFAFAVSEAVFAMIPVSGHAGDRYTGALVSTFIYFAVLGIQNVGKSLPFGLALGASRRSFYSGTALLGVSLALVSSLVIAGLQAIERATGGWGVSMSFFRVPYLLNGPWYATWLTSFVGLCVLFVYGMCYGTVYRRWGPLGTLAFIAAQVLVVLAGVSVVSLGYSWTGVEGHLANLTALDLTGIVAVLTVVLLAGGHAAIRHAAV
jgi:hypothetical protein